MKFKRVYSVVSCIVVLSLLLAGCSTSMKLGRVAAKFGKALQEQPITSATAEINCGLRATSMGLTSDLHFHTVTHTKMDWDQQRSYSDIITTVSAMGADVQETMQCYSSGESGSQVRYVHVDGLNTWVRMENQKRAVDIDPKLILALMDKAAENAAMEVTENTVGGGDHYILRVTFTAEDILDFINSSGIMLPDEFKDCDFKGVTVPVELEIEDKTYLPVRMQMTVKGINDSIVTALARAFAKGQEIQGVDIEMEDITLLFTNFSYGPQEIPLLPMGAAEKALDMAKIKEIQN